MDLKINWVKISVMSANRRVLPHVLYSFQITDSASKYI